VRRSILISETQAAWQKQMLQADDEPTLGCEQNKMVVRRLYEEVFGQGRLELGDQPVHPKRRDLERLVAEATLSSIAASRSRSSPGRSFPLGGG
jgi:hypothetical protein